MKFLKCSHSVKLRCWRAIELLSKRHLVPPEVTTPSLLTASLLKRKLSLDFL